MAQWVKYLLLHVKHSHFKPYRGHRSLEFLIKLTRWTSSRWTSYKGSNIGGVVFTLTVF